MALGPALLQLKAASEHLHVRDVVLSMQAYELAVDKLRGEQIESGHLRMNSIVRPPKPVALSFPELPEDAEALLRSFVPKTVLSRIDARQANWLSDLRQVTVLFVELSDMDVCDDSIVER